MIAKALGNAQEQPLKGSAAWGWNSGNSQGYYWSKDPPPLLTTNNIKVMAS